MCTNCARRRVEALGELIDLPRVRNLPALHAAMVFLRNKTNAVISNDDREIRVEFDASDLCHARAVFELEVLIDTLTHTMDTIIEHLVETGANDRVTDLYNDLHARAHSYD